MKNKPSISVISPSIRKGGLDMVSMCLSRQTFQDFEWITACNYKAPSRAINIGVCNKENNYYSLNRDWNRCLRKAKGELFVSIVDLMWFLPDTLENFWVHYKMEKKQCVGGIGHQYERVENNKPEGLVWKDVRMSPQSFYQIPPIDFELCMASLPMDGVKAVGGFDEEFDQYAAMSEKELCIRMAQFGYTFYIDQTLEYRAVKHPRLNEEWDKHYFAGIPYFNNCIQEIKEGKRLTLPYLSDTLSKNNSCIWTKNMEHFVNKRGYNIKRNNGSQYS